MRSISICLSGVLTVMVLPGILMAQQDPTPDNPNQYVTRAEYEQLLQKLEAQRQQRAGDLIISEALANLGSRVDRVESDSDPGGTSRFLVTGFGHAGYSDAQDANSTFGAQVNPLFLWELNDRLLFEVELEGAVDGVGLDVEFANVSYLLNDRAAVSVGKFLTPLSHFSRDMHPSWINKLPDAPLYARHEGIVPMTSVGAQFSGAFPVADDGSKVDYAVWVSNGPALELDGEHAGGLHFANSSDTNGSKAVGGRVGYSPTESLNFGVGVMVSRVDPSGEPTGSVDATLQVFDFTYIKPLDCLGGQIDVRGEYARSRVDDPAVPYLDDLGLPIPMFNNNRQGGYLQAAFRPTEADSDFVRDLEFIARFDFLNGPHAVGVADQDRTTVGVDWWMSSSSVVKLAYQMRNVDGGKDTDAVLFQVAMGF